MSGGYWSRMMLDAKTGAIKLRSMPIEEENWENLTKCELISGASGRLSLAALRQLNEKLGVLLTLLNACVNRELR